MPELTYMRAETISRYMRAAAAALSLALFAGCVTGGSNGAGSPAQDAALTPVREELRQCNTNIERLRQNNATLIETNAKLTSQLDSGRLDQIAGGGDFRVRLSECEFRVRELEDSVVERDGRIKELEAEIDTYSAELGAALEYRRQQEDSAQAEEFASRLGEEKHVLLYDEFAVEFASELNADTVSLSRSDGKVVFTVQNQLVFKPGTVEITEKGISVLRRVAGTIKNLRGWGVTVGAHTDASKPGKALAKTYPTNWELSLARANAVVRYLAERESIEPSMLTAAGYGEYRPMADSDTREGMQQNLRIEFVFEPSGKSLPED